MKKLLTVLLVALMALSMAACSKEEPKPAEVTYTLGMGVVLNTDSSSTGNAQIDATVAAVVLDAEGKFVSVRIDCVQNKISTKEGTIDTTATFLTKMEKGDNYNMKPYGNSIGEWYEEVHALEEWLVGKTIADIENDKLDTESNPGHTITAYEDLAASMTMNITDFYAAIKAACNDDAAVKFTVTEGTAFKVGVAANSTFDSSSKDATTDADGAVNVYEDYAAVVVDAEGKILAALADATQPKMTFNADGEITGSTFKGTKRELKDGYNMVAYAADCNIEWYQQSANFTNYIVGMTAAEVSAIETRVRAESEPHAGYVVVADEELFAQCSIQIGGFQASIAKACEYAH